VREGPLELGELKPGQWRDLREDELAALFGTSGVKK
jgi:16S rRNA U516 pseudouridylate synthase RsuA-like enzyme